MQYSPDEANVLRSGKLHRMHASRIVPGDIVSVAVGDKIPADCRLLSVSSSSFRVDQAILTGESVSVSKSVDVVPDVKAVKQDMTNMLFTVRSHFFPLCTQPPLFIVIFTMTRARRL
jgi:P-type Ca2+ transporter type 2A